MEGQLVQVQRVGQIATLFFPELIRRLRKAQRFGELPLLFSSSLAQTAQSFRELALQPLPVLRGVKEGFSLRLPTHKNVHSRILLFMMTHVHIRETNYICRF